MRLTAQQTFDTVAKHLRQQGRRCADDEGASVLRTDEGAACAVGCFIAPGRYTPAMERISVRSLFDLDALFAVARHADLLVDLRFAHDTGRPTLEDCAATMRFIAFDYGLDAYALDGWFEVTS